MKNHYKKKFRKLIKKIPTSLYITSIVLTLTIIVLMLYTKTSSSWTSIEVKVTSPAWWYSNYASPPYWIANSLSKGDVETDPTGNKIAEITSIRTYENKTEDDEITLTDAYLSVNIKTSKTRGGGLLYKNQPIGVGSPIHLQFKGTYVPGIITDIKGLSTEMKKEWVVVKGQIRNINPWGAEALRVGDQMKNSQDEIIAEILDTNIELANKSAPTADGRIVASRDPLKRDVYITMKIYADKNGDSIYFRGDRKIKVDETLFVPFTNTDADLIYIMEVLNLDGTNYFSIPTPQPSS